MRAANECERIPDPEYVVEKEMASCRQRTSHHQLQVVESNPCLWCDKCTFFFLLIPEKGKADRTTE